MIKPKTHSDNPDTRDWLFQEVEEQARLHNRLRSYQPTSQDVARAYVSAGKRPSVLVAAGIAVLVSIGWWQR